MADKILIVIGSKSDMDIIKGAEDVLNDFGIKYELKVSSAHRTPAQTKELAMNAEANGFSIIIAGAGMAAHLPGVLASFTTLPIIGVPIDAGSLGGLDALFSIVQMPPRVPVASMGIGKAGAKNAAFFAIEILALKNEEIRKKYKEFRKQLNNG